MKGITLDVANSERVTFDKVKNMILKNEVIETDERFQCMGSRY